jgi:signal transduction histidine kinase
MNVIVGELSYSAAQLERAKDEAERRSVELAETQARLVAKERLATLGQLAGGVAHQIRTPLAVILNALSVLRRKLPADRHPDVDAALEMMDEEIRHANAIVTALLDYARLRKPERRLLSLPELVDRVLGDQPIPANVVVRRTLDAGVPLVHADGEQMHEVLVNLVTNAVDAMPDGGTLQLEVSKLDGHVVIAVTDDGDGIPDEIVPHLFEPLRSTKPMGVGLGLVTAFVEAHGGHLSAVPRASGARFEIRLPIDGVGAGASPA